jgi:hypothetical protein
MSTETKTARIVRLLEQRLPRPQIARLVGCKTPYVHLVANRYGFVVRDERPRPGCTAAQILAKRAEAPHLTARAIAAELGTSEQYVWSVESEERKRVRLAEGADVTPTPRPPRDRSATAETPSGGASPMRKVEESVGAPAQAKPSGQSDRPTRPTPRRSQPRAYVGLMDDAHKPKPRVPKPAPTPKALPPTYRPREHLPRL